MTKDDKKEFAAVMYGLALALDKPITSEVVDIYFRGMEDLSIEQIKSAGTHFLKTSKFFPKVADFFDFVHGDANEAAQKAWVLLVHTVERMGSYPSLIVKDGPFGQALQNTFGGWVECCDSLPLPSNPMFASFRKQFIENYRVAAKDQPGGTYFPGRSEAANRLNCATFTRGLPAMDGDEPSIAQRAGAIINGRLYELSLNFSVYSGTLTANSRAFIEAPIYALSATRLNGKRVGEVEIGPDTIVVRQLSE